jgi:sugar phosphate isomerase/epimerase
MIIGGQIRSLEDIGFLEALGFELGEVSLRDKWTRNYWIESGVSNRGGLKLLMKAHGPQEGLPNDLSNLWGRYYPELKESVDTCAALAIDFLTIHLWMDKRFVEPDILREKIGILRALVSHGKDHGVRIGLENLSESADDLGPVIDSVPGLAITLDVGHGQLLAERNTCFDIVERLISSIAHLHLHDNHGGSGVDDDEHLPVGAGSIDFTAILSALTSRGYDGTMVLEVRKEDLELSAMRVRSILDGLRQPG